MYRKSNNLYIRQLSCINSLHYPPTQTNGPQLLSRRISKRYGDQFSKPLLNVYHFLPLRFTPFGTIVTTGLFE